MARIGKGMETIEVVRPSIPVPFEMPTLAPAPTRSAPARERELVPAGPRERDGVPSE